MDEDFIVESKAEGYFSEAPAGLKVAKLSLPEHGVLPAYLLLSVLHSHTNAVWCAKGSLSKAGSLKTSGPNGSLPVLIMYAVFFTQQAIQPLAMVSAGNNRACLLLPALCMTSSSPTERFSCPVQGIRMILNKDCLNFSGTL